MVEKEKKDRGYTKTNTPKGSREGHNWGIHRSQDSQTVGKAVMSEDSGWSGVRAPNHKAKAKEELPSFGGISGGFLGGAKMARVPNRTGNFPNRSEKIRTNNLKTLNS